MGDSTNQRSMSLSYLGCMGLIQASLKIADSRRKWGLGPPPLDLGWSHGLCRGNPTPGASQQANQKILLVMTRIPQNYSHTP